MLLRRIIFYCFGVLFSLNVKAVSIVPEPGVSILYVNGKESESKISSNEIVLGHNQLLIRLDKKVGRGNSAEVFTSDPYVIEFKIESDEDVKLYHPRARSSQEAVAAFSKQEPEWLIKQSGELIAYRVEKLKGREGFLPYGDLEGLLAKHNEQAGMAVMSKIQPSEVTSNNSVEVKLDSALQQLQHWYTQATTEERKAFRKWMVDQE
ncbi:TPA: DUF2057 domain-containing protein [Vibrio vulnificus]|nr:DUF2057 domain-containing protein [Vibrio vulnificus]